MAGHPAVSLCKHDVSTAAIPDTEEGYTLHVTRADVGGPRGGAVIGEAHLQAHALLHD